MNFDSPWKERAAYAEIYTEYWTSLAWELLAIIQQVEDRQLTGLEAQHAVKTRFRELMSRHFPKTDKVLRAVEERLQAEENRKNLHLGRVEEGRRQREREETARIERQADERYREHLEACRRAEERMRERALEIEEENRAREIAAALKGR